LLATETNPGKAIMLLDGVTWLDPGAEEERAQARVALFGLLAEEANHGAVHHLAPRVGPARGDGTGESPSQKTPFFAYSQCRPM